jgi:hypothetical protein
MPYSIRKVSGKDCYSVRATGKKSRVTAKCTTLEKAKKQLRLLYALDRPGFVPRRRTGKKAIGGKRNSVKRLKK